jgi:G3E family GTPase
MTELPSPVTVLTGFLGSGKTTLLSRLLRRPEMGRTAVVINELGEIGLDHELVEASDEDIVQLAGGCICCTVRSDLVLTVGDLIARRDAGTVPRFERILIETTGLADPAPIVHALNADPALAERTRLAGIVATVDAAAGMATLDAHPEAVKQAAVADRLVLTKTDLAPAEAAPLRARLARLNPSAVPVAALHGDVAPEWLLDDRPEPAAWLRADAYAADPGHAHAHDDRIRAWCIVRDAPIRAVALTLFLEALADNCGPDLLRMKGIVAIAESPDRPAVVHGVQHVFHPPAWLDRWPSSDRRTRLVFITRDIPRAWLETLLELLDEEVGERQKGWSG